MRGVNTWVGKGGEEKGWYLLLVEVSGRRPEGMISIKFPLVRAIIGSDCQFGTINIAIYKKPLALNGMLT